MEALARNEWRTLTACSIPASLESCWEDVSPPEIWSLTELLYRVAYDADARGTVLLLERMGAIVKLIQAYPLF